MNPARLPLVAGNWKMFKGQAETRAFCAALRNRVPARSDREVAVFPPFTSLPAAAAALQDSHLAWGAQNMHWEKQGAFTGEVAAGFLVEMGCRYVLVGHSERRALFAETDEACNHKVRAALAAGLRPVLCCGETLEQREAGQTFDVLAAQLGGGLAGLSPAPGLVVAYEPVWAIGTGRTATPAQAGEVHSWLRDRLGQQLGPGGSAVRVLYGGSVKPDNVDRLLAEPDVDGVLVGGASIEFDAFVRIAGFAPPGR
ncbi:triose-phosphate isomerase [candidate division WOR-3 bacterium]|nr:triose-phosphate isomerase [candidate division WOR-3 bacterium]